MVSADCKPGSVLANAALTLCQQLAPPHETGRLGGYFARGASLGD